SGGRLDLGIGKGFSRWEYTNFGVPFEEASERFDEALDVMLTAWQPSRFDFDGKYYRFRDVQVLPKPVQQPHPRLWASAVRTRDSYEWAGRRGYDLLTAPFMMDRDRLREYLDLYHGTLAEAGHSPAKEVLGNLHVCVAPTRAEAVEAAAPCFARMNAARNAALSRDPSFPRPRPAPAPAGAPTAGGEGTNPDSRSPGGRPGE